MSRVKHFIHQHSDLPIQDIQDLLHSKHSNNFKKDPFALLIHGTQKKGYFKNLKK